VFSKPGVYLVQVKIDAELVDGKTVSDTQVLRFAVGSETDAEEAFTAAWRDVRPAAATPAAATVRTESSASVPVGVLLGAGALLLAAGFAAVVARGRSAKRRARG
jgi:surface-anchored protein